MKLGEMLIHDGHVREEQIQQAIAKQAQEGGRLGTVLVEMGAIDLDTLTVYLGLELGIPIATIATLSKAKRMAVRLLKPEQAAQLRCIPILIQDRQLIIAIDNPHDMERLDALTQLTGYRTIPRVAPEIRIYHFLERYYGIAKPQRFRSLLDNPHTDSDLPAPPLPGLPPVPQHPVAAPTPTPSLRTVSKRALEIEATDLLEEMESDRAETAPPQHILETSVPSDSSNAVVQNAEVFAPINAKSAIDRIDNAQERSEIARALMCYMAKRFHIAIILIVRDNMAFGWKGFGPSLDYDRIETLLVPLEVPSMFQTAIRTKQFFNGECCSRNAA